MTTEGIIKLNRDGMVLLAEAQASFNETGQRHDQSKQHLNTVMRALGLSPEMIYDPQADGTMIPRPDLTAKVEVPNGE